jgi:hypothetical protein
LKLLSFDGFSFSQSIDEFKGGVLWDNMQGQFGAQPSYVSVRNDHPMYTGMAISSRTIPVQFTWAGSGSGFWADTQRLLARLDWANPEPRKLLLLLDDGITIAERDAIVSPIGPPRDTINAYDVQFFSADPQWHAQSVTTAGPASAAVNVYGGVDVVNSGMARSYAALRLAPSGTTALTVRRFSITNNTSKALRQFPWRIDFGSATFNASPPGTSYKALLKEGVLQRCELVNWFGLKSYLWLVIDALAPGARADYDLLESTSYIMPGTGFNSYTRPAFDIGWEAGTTSAAGSTTTIVKGSATWETNQWKGGVARMLTGADAGVERTILSNTATTITTSAFGSATGSGSTFLLTMSSNGKWVYPVRQTERSDSTRGLWWINSGQSQPSQVRWDVPGGWQRYLYVNNDDEKTQARWTAFDPGAGNDYFTVLNAQRSWKGGSGLTEQGTGDGVAISMPDTITQLVLNYQIYNPNRMAKMIVGARESGSEDFAVKYSDDAEYTSLTPVTSQTVTIGSSSVQCYVGLINRFGDSMGADWPKDSGTATAGSATTLTDATKAWSVNHWKGATLRITGGTGVGQVRTVTSHSGTALTVASWSVTPDATSQYTLQLPKLAAQLLSDTTWELSWTSSNISSLPPASAVPAYLMERTIYIGRSLSTDAGPYQRIRTDQATTDRYTVLTLGERLEIDGETMQVTVTDGFNGVVLRTLAGAVVVDDVAADGTTRLSERWLWLKPGTTPIRAAVLTTGHVYSLTSWHTAGWD